jgi:hypothetical protein
VDTSVVHIDSEFSERMLLVWPESSKQEVHDVRQVIFRTKPQALWEGEDDVEPAGFHTTVSINCRDSINLRFLFGTFSSPEGQIDSWSV